MLPDCQQIGRLLGGAPWHRLVANDRRLDVAEHARPAKITNSKKMLNQF